jgi:hypothetical protein
MINYFLGRIWFGAPLVLSVHLLEDGGSESDSATQVSKHVAYALTSTYSPLITGTARSLVHCDTHSHRLLHPC